MVTFLIVLERAMLLGGLMRLRFLGRMSDELLCKLVIVYIHDG